jgi:glycerol-3-phosphate dehydrogenase
MKRSENIAGLDRTFDLLVIGGGATGLGVAVDAAARGYSVALVDAGDFGHGTSSRSTKLLHGGVRYLRQGNIPLVREALHERGVLLRNAPHLTGELRFLIPAYAWWERPFYAAGLLLYDLLAGNERLTGSRRVSARAASRLAPTLARDGLKGGVVYSDGQFDDARLAVSLARTAHDLSAVVVNYAPVTALLKNAGRVTGATVTDTETGGEHTIRARGVVNATGVFTDAIRRMDDAEAPPIVAVSQGVHLVLDRVFLPGETAIMVPRTDDGRVVFLIPWQGRTLVGTTDTPRPAPDMEPEALETEIAFLLKHAGRYLTRAPRRDDVLSVFAGLRPLVKGMGDENTAALSRDHTLLVSASGLVTITGGKWTTYRRMAEDTVNRAAREAGLAHAVCRTESLCLHGADAPPGPWREFGADGATIDALEARYPGPLHPDLPYTMAMAAHVIREEMPVRLEDVLSRRLRALLLNARAATECAPAVATLMAEIQGRDPAWIERETDDFERLAEKYEPHEERTPNGNSTLA